MVEGETNEKEPLWEDAFMLREVGADGLEKRRHFDSASED